VGTQPMIHAAVVDGIGQTPHYGLFPEPVAGDDEAVVTVTAAALNPSDRLMANGVHYAPTRPHSRMPRPPTAACSSRSPPARSRSPSTPCP
jgi:NADPH:quinone reductase-like Zn-dependent oxidoreductase